MKNKLLVTLLTLALVSSSLIGCGKADDQVSGESEANSSTEVQTSSAEQKSSEVQDEPTEPVNIILHRTDWDSENTTEEPVIEALNEYLAEKINVTVTVINNKQGYKIADMLAAGEEIDMWWETGINRLNNYIATKAGYELTDVIENYPDLYNSMPEKFWETSKFGGKLWTIPVYKEGASGWGLIFRNEYVEKYNWDLSTVETWADMEPMLADLKEEGLEYPYAKHHMMYDNAWGLDEFAFVYSYAGIDRDGDTTKIVNITETEEYKEYLDLMYDWNQKGYISQTEQTSLEATVINENIANGNVGIVWWNSVPDNQAQAEVSYDFPLTVVDVTDAYMDTGSTAGSYYMINSKISEEKLDACLKFVELLFTDKTVANLLTYGIEGTHYTYNADGQVEVIPENGYTYIGRWATTSVKAADQLAGEKPNLGALYDEFNENAQMSVKAGFHFDASNVEVEVAALDAVISEYQRLLEHGFYDPDEYLPKYQKALSKAGINKVIAEIQAQYDVFLANK